MSDDLKGRCAFYDAADGLFAAGSGTQLRVSIQPCAMPVPATGPFAQDLDGKARRLAAIHEFMDTSLAIFLESIALDTTPEVYRLLMNDTPPFLRRRWHKALPDAVYAKPTFFRTDESPGGEILELQCPGSGWGDLQFLRDVYLQAGTSGEKEREALEGFRPAEAFVRQITAFLSKEEPSILHLLDNASAPGSMRYHISSTSPPLRYWGFTAGVDNKKCDFVRSHSFFGQVAENLFRERLKQAAEGQMRFDLPPIALFDQKAALTLPFWEPTRDRFSDEVRRVIGYSYPIRPEGFRDQWGEWVNLDEFERRNRKGRQYFVKYAGVDVGLNWGSRAVWRMADDGFKTKLDQVRSDVARGRPWLIQPDYSGKGTSTYYERKSGDLVSENLYAKYSRFYGPFGEIGTRVMFRSVRKVHGQEDTALGLVI